MQSRKEFEAIKARYRFFAYCVIRDAIAFYFGIPKFLESCDIDAVVETKIKSKLKKVQLSDAELDKLRKTLRKSAEYRVEQLKLDYIHCKELLYNDSIWVQMLGLDSDFLIKYLEKLPEKTKEELAVVPNWKTKDFSLGRPYLTHTLETRFEACQM